MFSLGFILSFLASGGILLWTVFTVSLEERTELYPQSLAVSVAAQISTAPVVLYTLENTCLASFYGVVPAFSLYSDYGRFWNSLWFGIVRVRLSGQCCH